MMSASEVVQESATKTAREKGKGDFLININALRTVEGFDIKQKGELFEAISNYILHDIMPESNTVGGLSARFFIQGIEENNQKWLKTCEKAKENVKKRWEQEKQDQADRDS